MSAGLQMNAKLAIFLFIGVGIILTFFNYFNYVSQVELPEGFLPTTEEIEKLAAEQASPVGLASDLQPRGTEIGAEQPQATQQCLAKEKEIVTKVIDGDTVVVSSGAHVRILEIDADEKDYKCYQPAKARLEELVLNKEVILEKEVTDVDKYGRCLRNVFLFGQNVGLQLVKEGLVIASFYQPDVKYQQEILAAQQYAMDNRVGCKWEHVIQ